MSDTLRICVYCHKLISPEPGYYFHKGCKIEALENENAALRAALEKVRAKVIEECAKVCEEITVHITLRNNPILEEIQRVTKEVPVAYAKAIRALSPSLTEQPEP